MKRNCLDDGPGIRTTIFFKGCPLSCVWCQNPESQNKDHELSFNTDECISCGKCLTVCQRNAIAVDKHFEINRDLCDLCFQCVSECPASAKTRIGKTLSLEEIMQTIERDRAFFLTSNGGVTLSGGEPALFPEFASDILQSCKKIGIHTLLETCGMFHREKFFALMFPYLDMIYFDMKIIDRKKHQQFCGRENKNILENFQALIKKANNKISILPRIPLIPDITATPSNLSEISQFLKQCNIRHVALLSYHPTWIDKPKKLGKELHYHNNQFMTQSQLDECKSYFKDFQII